MKTEIKFITLLKANNVHINSLPLVVYFGGTGEARRNHLNNWLASLKPV